MIVDMNANLVFDDVAIVEKALDDFGTGVGEGAGAGEGVVATFSVLCVVISKKK